MMIKIVVVVQLSWTKAMKVKIQALLIMTRLRVIFLSLKIVMTMFGNKMGWGSFYICAASALPSMPFTVAIKECQPSLWFSYKRKK